MQVSVEDHDRLQRKNLVDQLRQLRPGLDVQVHLQGAAGELVEIVHLAAPRLGLAGMLGNARREPADQQSCENEGEQSDRVGRISSGIEARTARAVT